MSGDEFHVHGVHDHAVEHAAEHGGGDSLSGRIAVLSAVLATLGAVMGFQGGDTQAKAQLYKNTAAITNTRANDDWNYYQAKGVKHNLAEFGAVMATKPDRIEAFKAEAERYKKEQAEIKARADKLEDEVKEWDLKSDEQMHQHHRWAQATTALQIAIAMAAMALLTKRRWLEQGVFVMSGVGLVVGALAYLHI